MLAFEQGYAPSTGSSTYEAEWFYSTLIDCVEGKPAMCAIMQDAPTEEAKQACIEILTTMLDKLNARWADGRTTVSGSETTYADFALLAMVVSTYENPNSKHADIREAAAAKL